MKLQAIDWEVISNKGTMLRIYKALSNSKAERQTTQCKNGQKMRTDILLKRIYRWQIKWRDVQCHSSSRKCKLNYNQKMQIKTTTHLRMVKIKKKIVTPDADKNAEKLDHEYIARGGSRGWGRV